MKNLLLISLWLVIYACVTSAVAWALEIKSETVAAEVSIPLEHFFFIHIYCDIPHGLLFPSRVCFQQEKPATAELHYPAYWVFFCILAWFCFRWSVQWSGWRLWSSEGPPHCPINCSCSVAPWATAAILLCWQGGRTVECAVRLWSCLAKAVFSMCHCPVNCSCSVAPWATATFLLLW